MIKQPEHPLGYAFEKAREWQAEQERQLTDAQRRVFDDIKSRHSLERRHQRERIDAVRTQLQEKAKNRKPKGELILNPPHLIADPYVRRQARFIIAAEKRLERLDRSHAEEQKKVLKAFEQEREAQKANLSKTSKDLWVEALQSAARQENDHDDRRYLTKEFDKSR